MCVAYSVVSAFGKYICILVCMFVCLFICVYLFLFVWLGLLMRFIPVIERESDFAEISPLIAESLKQRKQEIATKTKSGAGISLSFVVYMAVLALSVHLVVQEFGEKVTLSRFELINGLYMLSYFVYSSAVDDDIVLQMYMCCYDYGHI